MKTIFSNGVLAVFLLSGFISARASSLQVAGILGNSGEQGESLVRAGAKGAPGVGVVYDSKGTLWSSCGDGTINRYAVDGRQLASYPVGPIAGRNTRDIILLFDKSVMFKFNKKLLTLPLDAPSGTKPTALKVEAERLSYGSYQGWAAASLGTKIFWINASGETKDFAEASSAFDDLELTDDGVVYVARKGKLSKVDPTGASSEEQTGPGERPQWLNPYWYGYSWHGTIRRFNRDLKPDPGVVLGGGSGSFIGYVPGNHELSMGTGLARLDGNLYALAGTAGVLHLIEWIPQDKRFEIIRRIGSLKNCRAIGLDGQGRVWCHGGMWEWNAGPDKPLTHSVPGAGSVEMDEGPSAEPFAAVTFSTDVMVAPVAAKNGASLLIGGKLSEPVSRLPAPDIPLNAVACARITWNKRNALLMVDALGSGIVMLVDAGNGKPQAKAAEAKLETTTPLKDLVSLSTGKDDSLWAAAEGFIIEFTRSGDAWKEKRRWNSWGDDAKSKFGKTVYCTFDQGRLWVSDTDRNRILIFDTEKGNCSAEIGTLDKAGTGLDSFDQPKTLSAFGNRAVVFDSGNQRLVKLELNN